MASLSNINGLFDVHSTGAILFSTSHGTSGQILRSNGNAAPTWVAASTVIGGPYLPLSGGTLTGATATASGISFTVGGALTGTSATFNGNVAIGYAAQSNIRTFVYDNSSNYSLVVQQDGSGVPLQVTSVGSIRLLVANNGNVGIGTSSFNHFTYTKELLIEGDAVNTNSVVQVISNDNDSSLAIYSGASSTDDPAIIYQNDLRFGSTTDVGLGGYTERMRIDSSGSLFLNTTVAMDACFVSLQDHTNGEAFVGITAKDDSNVGIRLGHGTTKKWIWYSDPSDNLIWYSNAGVAERMRIDSSGRVGIGTNTPEEKMVVMGNIGFGAGGYNGGVFVNNTGSATGVDSNWGLEVQRTANTDDYNTRLKYYPTNGSSRKAGIWNSRDGYFTIYSNDDTVPNVIIPTGNVGIGTTNPSSELEVEGRAIVEKLEVARYSDPNAPAAVYVGRSANPMGQGGIFRLGAIESSSTVNKIDEPFLITYSSGHWGCQPMFFAEFTVTYYRGSYIKYWAQHEVSGSRLEIVDGPYGGQIITGGAPVSRTITQLCTNCHAGQPVYKCVWKWSNSGTYIKTSPIVSLVDGHGSARVYTSGSSSESAIDTLLGSAGSPGPAYLLMGINNAQAAGFTGLQTQN